MERITEKVLHRVFAHYANTRGWRLADSSWPITDPRREGAVFLEEYDGWWRISTYVECYPRSEPRRYTGEATITSLMPKRELVGAMRLSMDVASGEDRGRIAVTR